MKQIILLLLIFTAFIYPQDISTMVEEPNQVYEYYYVKDASGNMVKMKTIDGKYFMVRRSPNGSVLPDLPETYFVFVTSSLDSGSITVDPVRASYPLGSIITLTAVPNSGFQFVSWGGEIISNSNPLQITLTGENDSLFMYAGFQSVDTVHIIVSGFGGAHDDSVASAFRKGYLLGGSAFTDSLGIVIDVLDGGLVYANSHGTKMVIRSTTGLSSNIGLQNSYYPIQLVMPAGSNSYTQIYNSGGTLPAIISTGAGDTSNETGYDIEFYSNDPITAEPTDLSSYSNGYIAGMIYYIAKHTNGNIWTARYLLRQALGDSWTNTNGYGKLTSEIITSAIALYNVETNYSLLDPYN